MIKHVWNCKYREIIVSLIILILQILSVLYWSFEKTNYHIDELYSMGYASNFTEEGDKARYITESPEFVFDDWVENSNYKKYLIVSERERFYNTSFFKFTHDLFLTRNYMGLLNISESLLGDGSISSVPGHFLNILFFVIMQIMFLRLMKKLKMAESIRYIAMLMLGFSPYMISTAIFIRFYMLVVMFSMIMLNLFYSLWMANDWKSVIVYGACLAVTAFFSLKDSELTMVFFCAFSGCLLIGFVKKKKWRQIISCIAMFICALLFVKETYRYISILIHPNNYAASESVAARTSQMINTLSIDAFVDFFYWIRNLIENSYFASREIIYILAAAVTLTMISVSWKMRREGISVNYRKVSPATLWSLVVWIGILAVSVIRGQGRFICMAVLYILVIIAVIEITGFTPVFEKKPLSMNTLFIIMLVGETLIYSLFFAIYRFDIWRYYCFGFVSVVLVFWYLADRILKMQVLKNAQYPLRVALFGFVVINAITPFVTRNIEYVYEDEESFIDNVRRNDGLDVMLISEIDDYGVVSRHEMYDCVAIMPENTKIYTFDIADYSPKSLSFPNEFILWTHVDRDVGSILDDLNDDGYISEELGGDHCSIAYVVRKNSN